jgi:hypothetical protein
MKLRKLVLLISVLILPTQELLASNARDVIQPAAKKSPVAMPAQPATKAQATTPSQTVINPKVQVLTQGTDGGQEGISTGASIGLGDGPNYVGGESTNNEANLSNIWLSLKSDSVVVTAEVIIYGYATRLKLNWGDGQTDDFRFPMMNHHALGGSREVEDILNQGVVVGKKYTFQHVYQAGTREKIVTAQSTNQEGTVSSTSEDIDIITRYKLSFYSVRVEFPNHLDSSYEQYSEIKAHMKASQRDNIFFDHTWNKSVVTNPDIGLLPGEKISWRIDGSQFSREVSVTDAPVSINLELSEYDGLGSEGSAINAISDVATAIFRIGKEIVKHGWFDFDTSNISWPKIHPNDNDASGDKSHSNNIDLIYGVRDTNGEDEGNVIIHFSYDFKLIVPIDSSTSVFTMH